MGRGRVVGSMCCLFADFSSLSSGQLDQASQPDSLHLAQRDLVLRQEPFQSRKKRFPACLCSHRARPSKQLDRVVGLATASARTLCTYLFSVISQSSSSSSWVVLVCNKNEWRKQAVGVSLLSSEKRPRTKDDEEDWDMTLKRYFAHKAEKSQDRATASAYIKHRYRLEAYATLLSGVLSDVARAACRPTVMGWAHCLQDAGNRHSPTRPGTAQSPCNKRHASRNRLWLSFPSSLSLKCNLHLSDVSGTLQSITRLTLRYN
jgi:hypothetical protein